jgi:hypothetical protein
MGTVTVTVTDRGGNAASATAMYSVTSPTPRTAFGACPANGASPPSVTTKYGRAGIRDFFTGAFPSSPWVRPAGARTCHLSAKPSLSTPLTAAAVLPALEQLVAGDMVEVWHELDVKFRNGSLTATQIAQGVQRKAELYGIVKTHRPELLVVSTYAVWPFQSNSGLYARTTPDGAQYYKDVPADLIGVDFDGIGKLSEYPTFEGAISNVQAFVAANAYQGWTVPEFIHPRLDGSNGETPIDPDGSKRAEWATLWAGRFQAGGARAVHLYDFNYRPAQIFLSGSPEYVAWRSLVDTNA